VPNDQLDEFMRRRNLATGKPGGQDIKGRQTDIENLKQKHRLEIIEKKAGGKGGGGGGRTQNLWPAYNHQRDQYNKAVDKFNSTGEPVPDSAKIDPAIIKALRDQGYDVDLEGPHVKGWKPPAAGGTPKAGAATAPATAPPAGGGGGGFPPGTPHRVEDGKDYYSIDGGRTWLGPKK
jgi:hypothetical protein